MHLIRKNTQAERLAERKDKQYDTRLVVSSAEGEMRGGGSGHRASDEITALRHTSLALPVSQ